MISDVSAVLSFLRASMKMALSLGGFVPNMFWVITSSVYTHRKSAAIYRGS